MAKIKKQRFIVNQFYYPLSVRMGSIPKLLRANEKTKLENVRTQPLKASIWEKNYS